MESEITTDLLVREIRIAMVRLLLRVGDEKSAPRGIESLANALKILTELKPNQERLHFENEIHFASPYAGHSLQRPHRRPNAATATEKLSRSRENASSEPAGADR